MATKRPKRSLALISAAACIGSAASAAVILPSGDNDARASRAWYSGGNDYWVDAQASTTLVGYYDPSDPGYRYWNIPVVEFPIGSLAGRTDLQATLAIYFESVTGGVDIRYTSDTDGVVHTADWINAGTTITSVAGGTAGWVQIDVGSQIQALVDGAQEWAVFIVRPNDWWRGATIRSSEYASFSPQLTVIPEPAAALLAGVGLFALRRRR